MKTIMLAILLAAAPICASAGTINFAPTGCGLARSCAPDTDTGDEVQFNSAYGNYVRLYLNGVMYSSPGFQYLTSFDSYQLTAADGSTVMLTANFTTSRVCVRSGRAQHCSTNWYLTDGFILTP